jgi:hypothetical protein
MLSKRNVTIGGLALILLLVAVGLEHPYLSTNGGDGSFHSVIFHSSSVTALMKELSFALIIALVITLGIEHESRQHDVRNADEMRKRIAADVFAGVFSRRLDKKYVDLVISRHLQPRLIRPQATMSWTLRPHPPTKGDPSGVDPGSLIELHSTFDFTLENVTHETYFDCIPFRTASGNSFNRVISAHIGDKVLTTEEIEACRDGNTKTLAYSFPVSIPPGGTVNIRVESVTLKDLSSNEVWGGFHPTLATDFTITCSVPGISFGVLARTSSPVELVGAQDTWKRWRIDGPILKDESITVWWSPWKDPYPTLPSENPPSAAPPMP